jgi:hypothetical protein
MLKDNESFYIKSFYCETVEDDYEKGEIGDICSYWSGDDFSACSKEYKTIKDALKQIMSDLCYDEDTEWSDVFAETGDENERGRFDCDALVDADNSKPYQSQIDAWKEGREKLYNCHIVARIGVRSERELADDEGL